MQQCCVNLDLNNLEEYTRLMNVKRVTPLKKAVVRLLKKHHFLSVPQLVEKLKADGLAVHKTSVYRTIEGFLADGKVCQQTFKNEVVYELQAGHHDHLFCTNCGRLQKTECQIDAFSPQIKNFQIAHHHLTLFGTCAGCARS